MVFCYKMFVVVVVTKVVFGGSKVNMKLAHCLGTSLLDCAIGNSKCCCVVSLNWSWFLGVTYFFQGCSKSCSILGIIAKIGIPFQLMLKMRLQHLKSWCCCELLHCGYFFHWIFSEIEVSSKSASCAWLIEVTGITVNMELHVTGRESGNCIRVSGCIVQDLVDISSHLFSWLGLF
jgi:hypothetical protein